MLWQSLSLTVCVICCGRRR